MVDVHAPPDPPPRAGRGARPRARVPAHRRGDHRPQGRASGARRARAGGGDGLLQDPRSTRSCSSPTCPRTRTSATTSSATSRRRCPSATRRDARAPAAARDHRDASSPTSSSTAPARRSSFRLREETGAPPSILARALRGRARGVRHALVLGGGRGARQPGRRRRPSCEMLIEGRRLVERATRWLVRAQPARDRHRSRRSSASSRAQRMLREALPGRARRRRPRGVRRARSSELSDAGVPRELAGAGRRHAVAVLGVRHRRGRGGDRTRPGGGDGGLLPARLAARAQLAARPDHRAAARQPLAGAGARGAARRPLQPAPVADPGGARGRRARRRQRGGDRRLGRSATSRRVERCLAMLADIKASRGYDTTTLPVALREVRNLIHADGGAARGSRTRRTDAADRAPGRPRQDQVSPPRSARA